MNFLTLNDNVIRNYGLIVYDIMDIRRRKLIKQLKNYDGTLETEYGKKYARLFLGDSNYVRLYKRTLKIQSEHYSYYPFLFRKKSNRYNDDNYSMIYNLIFNSTNAFSNVLRNWVNLVSEHYKVITDIPGTNAAFDISELHRVHPDLNYLPRLSINNINLHDRMLDIGFNSNKWFKYKPTLVVLLNNAPLAVNISEHLDNKNVNTIVLLD